MLQFLLDGAFAPFTLALALLTGLMVLELVALLLGGSLIGADSDADLDIDAGDGGDFDLDLDGAELGGVEGIDAADLDLPDAELDLELLRNRNPCRTGAISELETPPNLNRLRTGTGVPRTGIEPELCEPGLC